MVEARCLSAWGEQDEDGVKTCRRVLRTSNGWVRRADRVPEIAPERKEVVIGDIWGRGDEVEERRDLMISKPAQ
jgi:hypothetical protein